MVTSAEATAEMPNATDAKARATTSGIPARWRA
jgi:hypothetical protein